ncbi:MAG TPA: serine/threonine-protein kinase, partial [Kofleriaceae bacterium]|nr:serine/threonine-protein kinase [Kofleriaceae bacterium]
MTYRCPVCQRSFAEPGFCPFDGKPLGERTDDQATVLSSYVRAQSDAETKLAESKTQQGVVDPNQVRALSAHEGHALALDTIRKRVSEYDRLIGETLDGRYLVQRKIGEGGMGVVFAVKHAVIERPLAIKVLKRNVMRDAAVIQRFIQEAKAASRIGHPNIVDVTDFGKTPDGMTYSVMEYVDGTTLSKTIKNAAPLPPERAVRIASQIARALAAAHGKGIVHRDLKPENVFLTDRDERPDFVKIVDFGIAKVQPVEGTSEGPRLTRAGSVFGTPEYMAPEQASGRGDTDHRVDIYALGVIMYEMLVGKVPLKGESTIRTIAMQLLDPITPPSQVNPDLKLPPALEAIVMKALAKKREERHQSMNELLAALEEIQPQLGVPQRSLPPLPPGADANLTPAPGVKIVSSDADAPRRPRGATRPLHEPEFVAPGTPVSLSHVFDDAEPLPEPRRWPLWLAGLLVLLVGAGGAILLISQLQSHDGDEQVTSAPDDAATIVEVRDDAPTEPPPDAMVIVELPPDAGPRIVATVPHDAGVRTVVRPERRGNVTIEILTRPGDANVFIAPNFRGPSGVKITEPYGTKRHIECKTDRMKGSIDVVFDGSLTAVM